jgi:uncharacterized membrane protein (UPF0127 family)
MEGKEAAKTAGVSAGVLLVGWIILLVIGAAMSRGKSAVPTQPDTGQVITETNENLPFTRLLTTPNGGKIAVRVADTDRTRQIGLSGFAALPNNQGMLFVFPSSGTYPFWMKNMRFSIDIIWMSTIGPGQYRVNSVADNISPSTYPNTINQGTLPADTVLEIPAGRSRDFGIQPGSIITY